MLCTKTGALIYDQTNDAFFKGDVFETDGLMVFRVAQRLEGGVTLFPSISHFIHTRIAIFDIDAPSLSYQGTIIAHGSDVSLQDPKSS